jgi:tetratricopeptide (TPR) repeat protein
MARAILFLLAAGLAFAAGPVVELRGRIEPPPRRALVALFGAHTPFTARTLADASGRFRFRKLVPGVYNLVVAVAGIGESRQTVEVSPTLAGPKGRIEVTVAFEPSRASRKEQGTVPVRQLTLPARAIKECALADRALLRGNVEEAIRRLLRAVDLAPQLDHAWNNLGVIYYQRQEYTRAEECFRKALAAAPDSHSALVDLGGVLLNLGRFEEALRVNQRAVEASPDDALANSQLGMAYDLQNDEERAIEHLTRAKRLDPAHFSRPQLVLARIWLRLGDRWRAVAELLDYLARHPDDGRVQYQLEALKRRILTTARTGNSPAARESSLPEAPAPRP